MLLNGMIPAHQNYLAGQWRAVATQLDLALCDSNTGELHCYQFESSAQQLDLALAAAEREYTGDNGWTSLSSRDRADYLLAAAAALETKSEIIAQLDSRFTGAIISLTRKLALICSAAFKAAADLLQSDHANFDTERQLLIERKALGPAAIIGPWNAPAGIVAHKLASALAAGCPAIVKPSEWAPFSSQIIVQSLLEAGIPANACQLLHGTATTGAALVSDPRIAAVSFTGGLAGGQSIAKACGEQIKPAQLELGGNNPLLILNDADLPAALNGVVTALTTLNGQWCRALGRLLVHRCHEQDLLPLLGERLSQLCLSSSMNEHSEMGPLAHKAHRDRIQHQVQVLQTLGAVAHRFTPLPDMKGWFYPPTLLYGLQPEHSCEEIFGPVAAVHFFDDDKEAIELANQTPFGLAAYVFGEQEHGWQVAKQIHSGLIKINAVTLLNMSPDAPRPAWGLSGIGDEGTRESFEFFRGTRVIGVAG